MSWNNQQSSLIKAQDQARGSRMGADQYSTNYEEKLNLKKSIREKGNFDGGHGTQDFQLVKKKLKKHFSPNASSSVESRDKRFSKINFRESNQNEDYMKMTRDMAEEKREKLKKAAFLDDGSSSKRRLNDDLIFSNRRAKQSE